MEGLATQINKLTTSLLPPSTVAAVDASNETQLGKKYWKVGKGCERHEGRATNCARNTEQTCYIQLKYRSVDGSNG